MSGARTTPKLLELQEECLARDLATADVGSSSDDSSDDDFDVDAIPGLACLESPLIPAALRQQHDGAEEVNTGREPGLQQDGESDSGSDEGSSQSGSDVLETGRRIRKPSRRPTGSAGNTRCQSMSRRKRWPRATKSDRVVQCVSHVHLCYVGVSNSWMYDVFCHCGVFCDCGVFTTQFSCRTAACSSVD